MPDQNEHTYPHQNGNGTVTREHLAEDFSTHPEAYHNGLHEPIRTHLGAEALHGVTENTSESTQKEAQPLYAYGLWSRLVDEVFNNEPLTLTKNDIEYLIENDYAIKLREHLNYVKEYIDIEWLSNRLVKHILNDDVTRDTFHWLGAMSLFSGLDSEVAMKLINNNADNLVVDYLECYKNLKGDVLDSLVSKTAPLYEPLVENLDRFEDISEATLQKLRDLSGRPWLREYPRCAESTNANGEVTRHPASTKAKDMWFADMSFAYLEGGFTRSTIGRLIRLRVEAGESLHDASQWLEVFAIPEKQLDIGTILDCRDDPDFDANDVPETVLRDVEIEQQFFEKLASMSYEERQRVNLSGKDSTERLMFSDAVSQLLYRELLADYGGEQFYKSENFTLTELLDRASLSVDNFHRDTGFGYSKAGERTTHNETVQAMFEILIDNPWRQGKISPTSDEKISIIVQKLKQLGFNRQAYVRDTEQWLLKHASSPSARLRHVWRDRPAALARGYNDTAQSIELWQKNGALEAQVEQYEQANQLHEEFNLERNEVLGEQIRPTREELLRVLSSADTIYAMSSLKIYREKRDWSDKLLPPAKIEVAVNNAYEDTQRQYTFEILEKDDPRGYTIGEDTDCCMTLHGLSESCIVAGYERQNAGFMALYGEHDRLEAQSFWYVNPNKPDVLVIDNVETTAGKDLGLIRSAYQEALGQYLQMYPQLNIKSVHVGTGYSDVNLSDLPKVKAVAPLDNYMYTDADRQKLLLKVP